MTSVQQLYDDLPGIRAPRQDRSRRAFAAALDALEGLLAERPLASVGVQDVADRAGLSVTSIYARVDGKAALVMALHERVVAAGLVTFDEAVAAIDPETATVASVVVTVVEGAVAFSSEHHHVFAAVAESADIATYQRAAAFIREGSERISGLVLPLLDLTSTATDEDVDFAWRSTMAVLQQRWALGGEEPGRHRLDDAALTERLTRAFLAHLGIDPTGGTT